MIMQSHVPITRLLALAIPFALAGCVKLARESPQLQTYVLGGVSAAAPARATAGKPSASRGAFRIGLRRVELASYLFEPAVLIRRGTNQLVISQFHRWGGDLDQGINRAVGAYLTDFPRVSAVDVAPWPTRVRHDVLVQLHISRFEGVADSAATQGRVHVMAGWDIIRPFDGKVLVRGITDDLGGTFRVGDYAGLVTALDAGLVRVARDIGACLARFPNDSTPPPSCGSALTPTADSGR
jgi:uncharacterized lipoprotein YmbA